MGVNEPAVRRLHSTGAITFVTSTFSLPFLETTTMAGSTAKFSLQVSPVVMSLTDIMFCDVLPLALRNSVSLAMPLNRTESFTATYTESVIPLSKRTLYRFLITRLSSTFRNE